MAELKHWFDVLRRAALGLLLVMPIALRAEPAKNAFYTLKMIAPGVYAAIDGPDGRAGANAGFVIGDDGVLVIDSFENPEAAKALLADIRALTAQPVRYVVNTHYHIDHVAGDGVFKAAGATIIAHRNVRGWVRTENAHLFGDHLTAAEQAMIAGLTLPDLGVDQGLTIWLGKRRVDVRVEKGHTGGDLVVAAPDARVLFCGDLLWRRVSPNVIDGVVSQWILTAKAFQQGPGAAETIFVPGHGDVADARDVAAFEAYLTTLSDLTRQGRAAGLSGAPLVAATLPRMKALFGDWTAFDYFAPKEIGYMEAELAGVKRTPRPAEP